VDDSADRERRRNPEIHGRRDRGERSRRHIRYQHTITSAKWSSEENLWTIEATRTDTGEKLRFTTNFFWMCQGYYRHTEGYTPEWKDMAKFKGPIVHPQKWPEDLDYKNKRVIVIGSGATAATLIPAMANDCAHVTMLQRSPTYFRTGRNAIEIAEAVAASCRSTKSGSTRSRGEKSCSTRTPSPARHLRSRKRRRRICCRRSKPISARTTTSRPTSRQNTGRGGSASPFIPDGDLFQGIKSGKASVVTDEIDRFTEKGILLKSGKELEADIIVTATGFHLSANGDIEFAVDGKKLDFADTVTYRGMMFTGVPNLVWVFGYFRASWTLRVDLVADFVCRLLNHMKDTGAKKVTPQLRPEDHNMPLLPWIDQENFNPGYMMRGMHLLPKRGDKPEWQHNQDYWAEKDEFPTIDLKDKAFAYG
jgi:cation diffusion facilitator CzcD-associated flavoprotein CzcO